MPTLIIGDLHGCAAELLDLLDKSGLASDDPIIAIGDLVDRGPDSPGVLRFFQQTPNAHSILGNHERKHIRVLRGEIPPAPSQVIARQQIGEAGYPAAVAFMDNLPRFLELPEATLVHGFWEPGVPPGRTARDRPGRHAQRRGLSAAALPLAVVHALRRPQAAHRRPPGLQRRPPTAVDLSG